MKNLWRTCWNTNFASVMLVEFEIQNNWRTTAPTWMLQPVRNSHQPPSWSQYATHDSELGKCFGPLLLQISTHVQNEVMEDVVESRDKSRCNCVNWFRVFNAFVRKSHLLDLTSDFVNKHRTHIVTLVCKIVVITVWITNSFISIPLLFKWL